MARRRDLPFALPQVTPAAKKRAAVLFAALGAEYPDAHCELVHTNPHELLVATILSAQATDAGVNKATPALFARFPKPADYAASNPEEIEPYIKTIGLYRMKAKAIHSAMSDIVAKFGGRVPRTMDELLTLRGVARKTANVVLGNAYKINVGFVVDTHIERLSKALRTGEARREGRRSGKAVVRPDPARAVVRGVAPAHLPREGACKARGVTCDDHPICRKFGIACELRRVSTSK